MLSLVGYSLVCFFLQLKDRHNGNILIDNLGNLIHIDFGFMLNNSPGAIGFETAPFKFTQEYLELLAGVSVGNVGHLEMKRVSSSIAEDSVADTDGVPDSNGGGTAASGSSSGPLSGQISSLTESELFKEFKQLMKEGFKAIRKNSDFIVSLLYVMSKNSSLPCLGTQFGPNSDSSGDNVRRASSRTGSGRSTPGGRGIPLRGMEENVVIDALVDRLSIGLSDIQVDELVEKLIMQSINNVNTTLYDNFQYYSNGIL
ncbi:Phosphatidylinositol 4-kinase PIK1 [Smittium mucronatum]|uniref:Phosphatidylinositol 4-kinase PIK1 n=1 Tax=Smittium mucronatum TaxID=133383 RepID=A0A1R0GRG1_9FUNG|nr:Phosphatidylinositol 4-kinase PIK1 [Smittium mucronatum]